MKCLGKKTFISLTLFFLLCNYTQAFFQEPSNSVVKPDTAIVDFRSVTDFKKQHIKGAVNLPFDLFWQNFIANQRDAFSFLASLGVVPTKNILLVNYNNSADNLISDAAFATILHYGGFKNVALLEGGMEGWVKKRLFVSSLGEEIQPKQYKFVFDEGVYYKQSAKKVTKKRKRDVLLCLEEADGGMQKKFNVVLVDIKMLFKNNMLKTKDEIEEYFKGLQVTKENVLIVYPDYKKESYALAFFLKYYVGFSNVFILKGGR